jgi:hypothetical protein
MGASLLMRRRALGLVAVLGFAGRRARAAGDPVGAVATQRGSVSVIRGAAILALAPGDPVFTDDIVRTAADARLLIVCRDGLRIAIGAGTEVALRAYLADSASGSLQAAFGLLRGIIRLIGRQNAARQGIEVDTRTALASVRSTEWLVEATGKGTGVLAITGEVEVRGLAGGVVLLHPGEGTDVAPGSPPRSPARWGEARRTDAVARTTL